MAMYARKSHGTLYLNILRRITLVMSVKVENLEHNMAKLTIEVSAEELEKALNTAYNKQKRQISVPGFRKGKVPRAMIEKMYGAEIFYEDAANELMQQTYPSAVDESGVDIVSRPTVDVVQIEKGKPFIYTAEVATRPEVTLGKYMGVTVTKIDTSVTEEEVEAELENQRNTNARTVTVTDRPVKEGDTAVIDFEGFVDGVAFDGGKAENHSLEIGSHSFIDTFEDQLVGKNAGDEVEVNVTFPEEYQAADLAGKPALFKVTIKKIEKKVLPEIDDELAQDVSDFDTLDEYKADIKAKLTEDKEKDAKSKKENDVVEKIIENATMDIADDMIAAQAERMLNEYAQNLQMQGLSFDMYMKYTGMTVEQLLDQMKPQALKRIQARLVLEAVAVAEKFDVTDEELDAKCEEIGKMYGMELDKVKETFGEEGLNQIKEDIKVEKAADFVRDNAVEK